MSMVPTFVKTTAGKYFKNPVAQGDWGFICFDDRDPPELVLRGRASKGQAKRLLTQLEIPHKEIRPGRGGQRIFSKGGKARFDDASSWFFYLTGHFPVTVITEHDGIFDVPVGDCCIEGAVGKEIDADRKRVAATESKVKE